MIKTFVLFVCVFLLVNCSGFSGSVTNRLSGTPDPSQTSNTQKDLTIQNAAIQPDGLSVVITVAPNGLGPLLPALGISGFALAANGSPVSIASISRNSDFEITIELSAPIASDSILQLSYIGGNVTDSAASPNPLNAVGSIALQNNAAFDHDVVQFANAVSLNGGSLSHSTELNIQTLVSSLKSNQIWSKMTEIYPFVGSGLASALVKLKKANAAPEILANSNFVESSYFETGAGGGLAGNGLNTRLDTGLDIPSLVRDNISIGAYVIQDSSLTNSVNCYMGSSYTATGDNDRFYMMGTGSHAGISGQGGFGSVYPVNAVDGVGFRAITYDGAQFAAYKNSVYSASPASGLTWQQSGTVFVMDGAGNPPTDGRLGFAFVGESLSASEMDALNSAVNALQTALNRNF